MKKTTIAVSKETKQLLEEEKKIQNLETFDQVITSVFEERSEAKNRIAQAVMEEMKSMKPEKKIKLSKKELDDLMDEVNLDDYNF